MKRSEVCDTLELTLCKGSGADEHTYSLNAAEKEVLLRRMDEFCHQTGMSLTDYAQQLREEKTQTPELQM